MSTTDKLGPFDFIKSLAKGSRGPDLMTSADNEKVYLPFITNRTLSYFPDSILIANELNRLAHLSSKMQFHLYHWTLRPQNRFTKFAKQVKVKNLEIIMAEYNYSREKALAIVDLISPAHLKEMKKRQDEGGTKKR